MASPAPRVSVGMPVFNGATHMREAIDSILGQTFEDFELIISDNASTDDTETIARGYADRDGRVRYHRNSQNLGAAANLNRVFALGTGEYFKWATHDDMVAPEYLAKCVAVLDRDSEVVVAQGRTRVIDEQGRVIQEYVARRAPRTDSPKAPDRFFDIIAASRRPYEVSGLIRARTLRRTSLHESYPVSDRVLLARLALFGRFHEIPEYLFFSRQHAGQASRAPSPQAQTAWFDPATKGKIVLPKWRLWGGYWRTLGGAPLSWPDRARCYGHMVLWTAYHTPALIRDLTEAGKVLLLRSRVIRRLVRAARHPLELGESDG